MPMCRVAAIVVGAFFAIGAGGQVDAQVPDAGDDLKQFEEERTDAYAAQLESYLRKWLVDEYPERAAKAWNRDYSSIEAFLASVEPNRKRWRSVIKPPELTKTGDLQRRPHPPLAKLDGEWLTLPLGGLTAEGLLVIPAGAHRRSPSRWSLPSTDLAVIRSGR